MTSSLISGPTISGTVSLETRRQWAQFCESRHRGWQLSVQDPWSDSGRARVVLIQSVFMLNFEYPAGDQAAQAAAREEAIAYANANPFRKGMLGDMAYFAFPQVVAFTAPLKPAGWVTGDAARRLNAFIDADDVRAFEEAVSGIASYLPEDYTTVVLAALKAQAPPARSS